MINTNALMSLIVAYLSAEAYFRYRWPWAMWLSVAGALSSIVLTIGARLAYVGG